MKNYPRVFIIILNYNGKDVIKKCLASVFRNDYPDFEVVVVDNNSADGSLEAAKNNFSKAHFIKNEANLGFSAGNNVGIRFALERMAEYVLLLNNDTEVEKDFLEKLVAVAENNSEIGIVSPIIFNGQDKQVWFSGGQIKWFTMKAMHDQKPIARTWYETGYVSGCAMLVKANVFKTVGLLDEDLFLYWEDVDFSVRAQREGFKTVMVADSWVYHFEKSAQNLKNKTYWLVVSGLTFFKKNTPAILKPWVAMYVGARKIKNWADVKFKKNDLAPTVQRAYRDYKKVKS